MIKVLIHTAVYFTLLAVFSIKSLGQETGYLIIESNVTEFLLVVDDDFENYLEVVSGDTLSLTPGERRFRMVSPNVNDNQFKSTIYADSILGVSIQFSNFSRETMSSYYIISEGNLRNFRIQTDSESEIFIDNKKIGIGKFDGFIPPGKRLVTITHPEFGSSEFDIKPSIFEYEQIHRYNSDPVKAPKFLQLMPGARFLQTRQYGKALITYSTFAILSINLFDQKNQYNNNLKSYDRLLDIYESSPTIPEAIANREKARDKLAKIESNQTNMVWTSFGIVAVYGLSTWLGLKKPKGGYKFTSEINSQAFAFKTVGMPNISFQIPLDR